MNTVYEIIAAKRDGKKLDGKIIESLIVQYLAGDLEDYQMSAFLMAAFIRGLDADETAALTSAMLNSGERVAVTGLDRPLIDKHSTGGVGDKLSLTLSPLLANCGIAVGMFSGRGLGHTGGTLDKLESIPGLRVFHSKNNFARLLRKHHWAITGQTDRIAPADKRIYALRDASGTVESIPLIVASIMSKKLALKSDGIVFDVKTGSGAFMKNRRDSLVLAKSLASVAKAYKLPARALVTNMDQPTGRMIGNFLEIIETCEFLKGGGQSDTVEMTLELGAEMLVVAGVVADRKSAIKRMRQSIDDGAAYENWCRYVAAVGGDTRVLEKPDRFMKPAHKEIVKSLRSGYIGTIDTGRLGFLAVSLGAGRRTIADKVDHLAGIEMLAKIGDKVKINDPLAIGYARDKSRLSGFAERYRECIKVGAEKPSTQRLVLRRL